MLALASHSRPLLPSGRQLDVASANDRSVFDLLNIDGEDLTSRPFIERKERLRELLGRAAHPRLRYVEHVAGDGPAFFRAVDALGLEGIVSKRARSVYRPGIRSTDWIKVKCFRTQHFAVVGYTTENGVLATLALAGEHEGRLHYAGRVEWRVPRRDDTLLRALETLGTNSSEWPHRGVAWVEPKLSAEVRSLAWSPGRHLRHAVLRTIAVS